MYKLKIETSKQWLSTVLDDFDSFLLDHAACERKASAMAMSLVAHYHDKPDIVSAMTDLAVEELQHFRQVMQIILERSLTVPPDEKDTYVTGLRKSIRHGRKHYFLDRLLVASIVEKRGHERFGLVAEGLTDSKLKAFYQAITRSEQRHYELFLELAKPYFSNEVIMQRVSELLDIEADIINTLPYQAKLH